MSIEWNKQALDSRKGQIICFGWAFDDHPAKCVVAEEAVVMKMVPDIIAQAGVIIGHNIKEPIWKGCSYVDRRVEFMYRKDLRYK